MKKLFYAFLLASVALTACNTDETSDLMLTDVELKASIDLVDGSRVAFDQEGDFFWTINDAIGVTTTDSKSRFEKMTMKEGGAGQARATFYAKYMSGTPKGYAVYPHNDNHSLDGSVLTYNFPTSYTYKTVDHSYFVTDGTGNSFNPAMWATIENGSVYFKHLGGVLCIMIADLPAGDNQTLTVTTSQRITGDFTADLSVAEPVLVTDNEAGNVVTINFSNAEESDCVFYVPVPTGLYKEICVSFEAEGEPVKVYFSDKSVNARMLKTLKIGDCELEGGEADPAKQAEEALRAAIAKGGSYTLTSDIVLGSPLVVATDFELDLNGHTISFSDAVQGGAMLTNNGTLIMKNGTVAYEYTGEADTSNSKGNYAIQNNGELAINNVKVTVAVPGKAEGEKFSHALYAVNNAGVFEMDGAESYIYNANNVAMRMWGSDNSAVTVKDGHIKGVRAIWLQLPSSSTTAAPKVNLTVEGGKLEATGEPGGYKLAIYSYNYGNKLDNVNIDVNGGEFVGDIALTGGANKAQVEKLTINDGLFNGGIYSYAPIDVAVQYVTFNGGRFTDEAKEKTNCALFGEGAYFVETADGLWTVEKLLEKVDENTYAVSTAEGLKWFAEQVNSGENYFEGKTIVLANDIDLNNVEWTPIGSVATDHGFMGNFDGNNKTIKNLKMTSITPDADGYVYAGLFGVTEGVDKDNSNFVKNLTIENVTIESEGHIAAAAIAYPYYTIVENITVKGDIKIKGGDYVSGVLAYTRRCVEVKNLTIEGNAGSVIEGRNTVGGVISDIQMNGGLTADYSNFKASGLTIKATKSVGGISGIISNQTLNGATVENVEIVCADARKGIVSGALGGKSTITNISYNNVTGATAEVGADYDTGKPVEAKVGDVYYKTSFQDVLANAKAGETMTLIRDITASDIVVVNKAVTIDGNGHKLTSTAARAINVQAEGNVVIKNLTVECTGERGVNVIQKPANVTLEQVTMTAANYTVNAAGSGAGATIAIKNSTLTGLNVVNIGGENVHVTVENTTLNCVDDSTVEGYSVLALNQDAKNSSIAATGCTFNIPAGSDSVKATNGAVGGVITIDGSTDVDIDVAAVGDGNYYYGFTTLEAAIAYAADNGQPVKLIRDIELSQCVVVEKKVTLDLNGCSISKALDVLPTNDAGKEVGYAMFSNLGDLTITDSKGNGKIEITYTGTPTTAVAVNTISNKGNLIINGGTISNIGNGSQIGYVIDNYNGSSLTVNGGKIVASGSSYYDGVRLFCSSSKEINVAVNGGEISSIWAQNPSNNKESVVYGTVVINNGKVDATYFERFTTVKVKNGVVAKVTPYGAGSNNTTTTEENGYTVYSFIVE